MWIRAVHRELCRSVGGGRESEKRKVPTGETECDERTGRICRQVWRPSYREQKSEDSCVDKLAVSDSEGNLQRRAWQHRGCLQGRYGRWL